MDAQFIAQLLQSTDATHIAANILIQTLESCAQEMALDGPDVVAQHLRQDQSASCACFCDSLTEQVAYALGALDERVWAIYAPDDTLADDVCFCGGIPSVPLVHLLIWRQWRTTAFDSLVAALDRALAQVYKDKIGTQDLPTLLDVHVIDDGSFEKHFGSVRSKRAFMRPVAYWLTRNEVVDIVYARGKLFP
jgi:hypothetical protein